MPGARIVPAHEQMMTLHLREHVEDHAPREDDPHYHLFERAKARLKRQGLFKCIVDDELCDGAPELHHTHIEFSLINAVDRDKIAHVLGLDFETDEDFQAFVESPANLEVLCVAHHRSRYGIHMLPGPLWEAVRVKRAGAAAPAEFVPEAELE